MVVQHKDIDIQGWVNGLGKAIGKNLEFFTAKMDISVLLIYFFEF